MSHLIDQKHSKPEQKNSSLLQNQVFAGKHSRFFLELSWNGLTRMDTYQLYSTAKTNKKKAKSLIKNHRPGLCKEH